MRPAPTSSPTAAPPARSTAPVSPRFTCTFPIPPESITATSSGSSADPAEEREGEQVGEATDGQEPVVRMPAAPLGDRDHPGHDHGAEHRHPGHRGRAQVDLGEPLVAADGQAADGLAAPG